MKKLFLELSFAALCAALLSACSGDSGSSADSLDESSSSSEMDGAESSDSEDLNSNGSEGSEGESSGSGGGESSGSGEGNSSSSFEESDSSSSGGGESSGSGEGNSSSSFEEPDSSSSEDVESSGSGEGSSASVPGGSSDASIYNASANTLKDLRDGQIYKTTTIEVPSKNYSEVWMAKNLNYETDNSWCGGGSGTTEGDCSVYGRLYTWDAAVGRDEDECGYGYECGLGSGDIRGACPKGWHLPSYDEWNALFTAVGGSSTAGSKLKSATGWAWNDYDDISGNGTDAFGFSALPAGYRSSGGDCDDEGNYAGFWSSTEDDGDAAYGMDLDYYGGSADLDYYNKNRGFSVRCLKD